MPGHGNSLFNILCYQQHKPLLAVWSVAVAFEELKFKLLLFRSPSEGPYPSNTLIPEFGISSYMSMSSLATAQKES